MAESKEEATVTIKNKRSGQVSTITQSEWEAYQKPAPQHGAIPLSNKFTVVEPAKAPKPVGAAEVAKASDKK